MKMILFGNLLLQTYYKELNHMFFMPDEELWKVSTKLRIVYQSVNKQI